MTAAELQRDLVEEMKKLFQGITTENTSGETVTGLNVYEQNLPVVTDDEEDESQFFPYALVKLETGKTADDDSPWVVATEIHFGICDHSKKNIGHRHIMNMIQDVVDRFAAEPLLNKKFRAEQDIEWAIRMKTHIRSTSEELQSHSTCRR